jgi:hypothetical protein
MRRHCNLGGMMFAADIDRVSRHTEDSSKSVGVSRQSSLLLDNTAAGLCEVCCGAGRMAKHH